MQALVDFFRSQRPEFTKTLTRYRFHDSPWIPVGDTRKLSEYLRPKTPENPWLIDYFTLPPNEQVRAAHRALDAVKPSPEETRKVKLQNNAKYPDELDPKYIHDNIVICRDPSASGSLSGYIFYDEKAGKALPYDFHAVHAALWRGGYSKNEADEFIRAGSVPYLTHYDPHSAERFYKEGDVYYINTYEPPFWKSTYQDTEPSLPVPLAMLFEHLFPIPAERDFVHGWIYNSLFRRAETYLYLSGGQGSGKTTLAKLLTRLHGIQNTSNPRLKTMKKEFNTFFQSKTFMYLDEFSAHSKTDKDELKYNINSTIQIEGKGTNAQDLVPNRLSFLIMNNVRSALHLEPIDRRFSVPKVSDEQLLDRYGGEWCEHLIDEFLVSPEFEPELAAYVAWLKDNHSNQSPLAACQNEAFEEIVWLTARSCYRPTMHKIKTRQVSRLNYEDERRASSDKRSFPPDHEWCHYLSLVTLGGEPIVTLEPATLDLIPTEKYQPEKYLDEELS